MRLSPKQIEVYKMMEVLYEEHGLTVTVAKIIGCDPSTVENYLKKQGLYKKPSTRILSREDVKNVISLYEEDKLTTYELATRYKVSATTISKELKEAGIKVTRAERYSPIQNKEAFQNIDCELKAWLLGFILADGCIHTPVKKPNSKVFTLEVQERDKEILIALCFLLGMPRSKIHWYHRANKIAQPTVVLSMHSVEFCSWLESWNCSPRKSLTLTLPSVPEPFQRDMVRGLIDGDGTIDEGQITLYGCKNVCDQIHELWLQIGVKPESIKRYNTTCHRISVFQKLERAKIDQYLYENATYALTRKAKYSPYWNPTNSKLRELLEKPEEVNQQPSLESDFLEGSTTRYVPSQVDDEISTSSEH